MSANARNVLAEHVNGNEATARAATAIADAFDAFQARFAEITRGVRDRFERRDWVGTQDDAAARLALYRTHVLHALDEVRRELGPLAADDSATARLAATVAIFLEEGSSFVRAGRRLGIHANTVAYRVHRAEALLGRPVTERQLELRVALRLTR